MKYQDGQGLSFQPYDPVAGWTYGDTIANIEHVGWHWPDGVHTKAELDVLEPGRRSLPDVCPCRNCARDRAGEAS